MKKLLYVLIAIDIFSLVVGVIFLLAENIIYAIVAAALGILNLVPLFAIVHCLDTTEQNTADISYLYYKLKKLETEEETPISYSAPLKHSDSPKKPWKCLKCDTVNKAEDSICAGCKAEYNYLNPTFDSVPKKKSRFVKF